MHVRASTIEIVRSGRRLWQLASASIVAHYNVMSQCDLAARRASNNVELVRRLLDGVKAVGDEERSVVVHAVRSAETALRRLAERDSILADLIATGASGGWHIAIIARDAFVEQDYPHTHGPVILLPYARLDLDLDLGLGGGPPGRGAPSEALVKLLVHERVHVLQRSSYRIAGRWIEDRRPGTLVTAVHRSEVPPTLAFRLRSNPDLDEYVYRGVASAFSSVREARRKGLGEAVVVSIDAPHLPVDGEHEHPFEEMAYDIADRACTLREKNK